ncbi:MAG: FAD-binding oxidoreductase [Chloroflexota bacterium]
MTQNLNINGNLYDPATLGEAAYEQLLMGMLFNKRPLTQKPDLLVQPRDVDDVITTVNYAREAGKKITIGSGGHSWSANHMRNDSILIDLGHFNQFEIDREAQTATAGPGTDGSTFLKAAMKQGFFFPVGHCKGVCIGGYLLQGGFGWNSRKIGMGCENVLGLDIVTADGEFVHASETENSDLYWAARGSGPGFFGIVVRFYLQLHPKPKYIGSILHYYRMEHLEDVFRWAAQIGPSVPDSVEFQIAMTQRTLSLLWPGLEVFAPIFADSKEELEEAKRLMQECPIKHKAYFRTPYLPTGMDLLYKGVMMHYPENHCLNVDNMWTTASIDDLLPHLREIADTMPSAPTHMLWLNWYPPKNRPDMAYSLEENIYIALYNMWQPNRESESQLNWATEMMDKMDYLSSGIQLADENLNHRAAKFLTDDNLAKVDAIRARWDAESVFNEWHSKPQQMLK